MSHLLSSTPPIRLRSYSLCSAALAAGILSLLLSLAVMSQVKRQRTSARRAALIELRKHVVTCPHLPALECPLIKLRAVIDVAIAAAVDQPDQKYTSMKIRDPMGFRPSKVCSMYTYWTCTCEPMLSYCLAGQGFTIGSEYQ